MSFESQYVQNLASDKDTRELVEIYNSKDRERATDIARETVDSIIQDELKERGCPDCESDLLLDGQRDEFYCPICGEYDFERR